VCGVNFTPRELATATQHIYTHAHARARHAATDRHRIQTPAGSPCQEVPTLPRPPRRTPKHPVVISPLALAQDYPSCFAGGAFACPERPSPQWDRLLIPSRQAATRRSPSSRRLRTNTEEPNIKNTYSIVYTTPIRSRLKRMSTNLCRSTFKAIVEQCSEHTFAFKGSRAEVTKLAHLAQS
jgi:hypothetical protein